jgi:phosphoribosylanthranilate isomerase
LTQIKLCGLKNPEEVELAVALGVDAVGFVLSRSPRQVSPEVCRQLRKLVPPTIRVHGVFAAEPQDFVRKMHELCRLDIVQIHGNEENSDYWDSLADLPVLPALQVKDDRVLRIIQEHCIDTVLLDTYVPGVAGGTGECFDWEIARQAARICRVILAGGLTPENVGLAINAAKPWMVDVSGGIEKEKGVKDLAKMRKFVEAVKSAAKG